MSGFRQQLALAPTPMAGLALGIGSLGWAWENAGHFNGNLQLAGAVVAALLLVWLTLKFISQPILLKQDLAHPVVGSVVPTFSMALMVVSNAVAHYFSLLGQGLWFIAVCLHIVFLCAFVYHRSRHFQLTDMVPSWFVPPVGIIVAAVASPGGIWLGLSHGVLWFGLCAYALMAPWMLYRLIFAAEVPDGAKPTIAIMAAPASLSLAGYLTLTKQPDLLLVVVLLGVAVLMTALIYMAFWRLLRLPFSPAYAAFTFPLVIGATALYKSAACFAALGWSPLLVSHVHWLANLELTVASLVVGYVALRYSVFLGQRLVHLSAPSPVQSPNS